MKNSTQLNLLVDGLYRGSVIYPRIEDINSIDYNYDTYHKFIEINLNCSSCSYSIIGLLGSVIPNIPRNSKKIQVSLNYPKSVASHC